MKIYFLCFDDNNPSGGIKQIYRQVDVLNKHGFSAFVLHNNPGFRCNWFENKTAIAYRTNLSINKEDYLVIPEICGPNLTNIAPGIKKIIFNQNSYLTFKGYCFSSKASIIPYSHRDVVGVMIVSEENKAYLSYAFPKLNFWRIRLGFKPSLFTYQAQKKKQIAFMPRKNAEHALQVINLFKCRNLYSDYSFVAIENKNETEVSQILQDSLIFLSFGYPEGFGMPPCEAMACGCIVIGYHGNGGQEYFKPEFCYPIQFGDIITFAKTLEAVIHKYENNPELILAKGKKASEYVLREYSLEKEEASILATWQKIL